MKYELQYECIDQHCKTVMVRNRKDHLTDGLVCPRCEGPVIQKPFKPKQYKASDRALFVWGKIIALNKQHCFDLTPEQVDTVLNLGDEFHKGQEINNKSLLTIELESEQAVPKIIYKGKEVEGKREILFHWETDTSIPGGLTYEIEHADKEIGIATNRIERRLKGHVCD